VTGTRPKVAVVGGGVIGTAAARHLAKAGFAPTLFAPDEPVDKRTHHGVFGSHYDEGRITRRIDHDPFWAEAAIAAISRYAEIEAESGISFYTERGALFVGPEGNDYTPACRDVAARFGIEYMDLDGDELAARFPFLSFSPGTDALFEPAKGGFISPRRLVAAQREAARRAGAAIRSDYALGVEEAGGSARVRTTSGAEDFDQIIVASGLMTDHVLGREPTFRVIARTVALAELSQGDAARLADMPPVLFDRVVADYVLPPIPYPDGRTLLKAGGEAEERLLTSPEEIGDWFRAGGNPDDRDAMAEAIRRLIPGFNIKAVQMDACATSYTVDEKPEIRRLSDHVTIAAGGCGGAAKSSDEYGRRAFAIATENVPEGSLT
jgi:sarcosine oxidase